MTEPPISYKRHRLPTIETDPKNDWLAGIRSWCAYNRSLVAEPDGEVVSVMIVVPPPQLDTAALPDDGWKLHYATTREDYRGQDLFRALFVKAVEPFDTVYAEVDPGNTSEMREKLLRRGFEQHTRFPDGIVRFKLTRGAEGECDHSA